MPDSVIASLAGERRSGLRCLVNTGLGRRNDFFPLFSPSILLFSIASLWILHSPHVPSHLAQLGPGGEKWEGTEGVWAFLLEGAHVCRPTAPAWTHFPDQQEAITFLSVGGHSSPLLFPRQYLPCCRPKSGEQQKGWGKQVETAGMSESQ